MSATGLEYWHVDAFTCADPAGGQRPFTGNQAAVMPLNGWLSDATLQAVAAENNFAETAFIIRDETGAADWELRWFTPTEEVRLCGHATMASGHVVLSRDGGETVRFRTRKAGILEVRRAGEAYELALPAIRTVKGEWAAAAGLLRVAPQEIWRNEDGYDIFLYPDEATVRTLDPDIRGLGALGDNQFMCTAPGTESDIVSRVFVPGGGVDEDSFTGSAHATLTPFWADRLGRSEFTAHQASRRGGDARCRLQGDRAVLTGSCVTIVEGQFRLPG